MSVFGVNGSRYLVIPHKHIDDRYAACIRDCLCFFFALSNSIAGVSSLCCFKCYKRKWNWKFFFLLLFGWLLLSQRELASLKLNDRRWAAASSLRFHVLARVSLYASSFHLFCCYGSRLCRRLFFHEIGNRLKVVFCEKKKCELFLPLVSKRVAVDDVGNSKKTTEIFASPGRDDDDDDELNYEITKYLKTRSIAHTTRWHSIENRIFRLR